MIETLDGMKKGRENYAAREAIKFLERELQEGNRFVHAQKGSETLQSRRRKAPNQELQAWWVHTQPRSQSFPPQLLSRSRGEKARQKLWWEGLRTRLGSTHSLGTMLEGSNLGGGGERGGGGIKV